MITFNEWWKEYVKEHLACLNYRKDFERCWNAAVGQRDIQPEKDSELPLN